MNLYRISQTQNSGYDTFDSAVVAAENEVMARNTHPSRYEKWDDFYPTWATSPEHVKVELIGVAKKGTQPGVIVASFNAG